MIRIICMAAFAGMFLFSSCSGLRKTSGRKDPTTVKEYEERLYGKKEKKEVAESPAPAPEEGKPDDAPRRSSREMRMEVVDYGQRYQGVSYRYGGEDPKTGFDCSGLVCHLYRRVGHQLPRSTREQIREGERISLQKVRPGDLVFFGRGGRVNHVAVVVRNDKSGISVLHSTSSRGVRIDNISRSSYWKPRILQARRVLPIR